TKLELTSDAWSSAVTPLVLHTAPSNVPARSFLPYIGDYVRLLAVGSNFYGVFCGNNTPNMANFPNGVTYQRLADWTNHTLISTDGVTTVQPSIDPFFFQWSERLLPPRGPITRTPSPRGPITPSPRGPIIRSPVVPTPPQPPTREPGPITPAKKTPAKKTPAKKTPAKKTPAKKTPAKKTRVMDIDL